MQGTEYIRKLKLIREEIIAALDECRPQAISDTRLYTLSKCAETIEQVKGVLAVMEKRGEVTRLSDSGYTLGPASPVVDKSLRHPNRRAIPSARVDPSESASRRRGTLLEKICDYIRDHGPQSTPDLTSMGGKSVSVSLLKLQCEGTVHCVGKKGRAKVWGLVGVHAANPGSFARKPYPEMSTLEILQHMANQTNTANVTPKAAIDELKRRLELKP